jgi:hypothetical protein
MLSNVERFLRGVQGVGREIDVGHKWVTEQPFSKLEEETQEPGRDGLNLDLDHC